MLDYTAVAAQKTVNDIKKLSLVFTVLTQILYIAYLIYAIVTNLGFQWLNITLLAVSSLYFVFFLIANGKTGKKIKEAKKNARHTYKILKISASSFNLAVLLYSIYAFPEEVKPMSIVLASLMTAVWLLQLVIECLTVFAEKRINLFVTALKADAEVFTKPLNNAQNFVRKIRGEEPPHEDEPTRVRKMLDEKVEQRRAAKLREKHGKKQKLVDFIFKREKTEADENEFANK